MFYSKLEKYFSMFLVLTTCFLFIFQSGNIYGGSSKFSGLVLSLFFTHSFSTRIIYTGYKINLTVENEWLKNKDISSHESYDDNLTKNHTIYMHILSLSWRGPAESHLVHVDWSHFWSSFHGYHGALENNWFRWWGL